MTAKHLEPVLSPPGAVIGVIETLELAGFEAWLVGGCVRDSLLGRTPLDYDVATNAPPKRVQGLFPVTIPTGLRFGGITVLTGGCTVEVTAYRSEQGYEDGRHPDRILPAGDIHTDAARRDFTINALFWNPRQGLADPTGLGRADLSAKILRAVGDPCARFSEDALRILRAVRFSAQLGFSIEPDTFSALRRCAPGLSRISGERVAAELRRLLLSPAPEKASLLSACGGWQAVFGREIHGGDWTPLRELPVSFSLRLAGFCALSGVTLRELSGVLRLSKADLRAVRDILSCCRRPSPDSAWLKLRLKKYGPDALRGALLLWGALSGENICAALFSLQRILQAGQPWSVSQLAIGGRELLLLGARPEQIGEALEALCMIVLTHPEMNTPDVLLAEARLMLSASETPPPVSL